MPTRHQDQRAAFWARVDMSGGPGACWPWTGACVGYGKVSWRFGERRIVERAHRIAFLLSKGHLPQGRGRGALVVRHTCDNPPCCNPDHLVIGTQADNCRDMIKRGRASPPPSLHGDRHPRARLTATHVRTARQCVAQGASIAAIARGLGVGESTIRHAVQGSTWRNV